MSESLFHARVDRYLKSLKSRGVPIWWWKTHGGGRTKRGIPDLCLVLAGMAVYIELKAPGGKPTAIQLHRCEEIARAGGVAFVTDSLQVIEDNLCQVWPPLVEIVKSHRA